MKRAFVYDCKAFKYLDPARITRHEEREVPLHRSATGYGRKIPTKHMLLIDDSWHRVYMIQIANAGSAYVLIHREKHFLRDCDIPV